MEQDHQTSQRAIILNLSSWEIDRDDSGSFAKEHFGNPGIDNDRNGHWTTRISHPDITINKSGDSRRISSRSLESSLNCIKTFLPHRNNAAVQFGVLTPLYNRSHHAWRLLNTFSFIFACFSKGIQERSDKLGRWSKDSFCEFVIVVPIISDRKSQSWFERGFDRTFKFVIKNILLRKK
jgi:hypothetical protein